MDKKIYTKDELAMWAKHAIENPILNEIFESLKNEALKTFEDSPARDTEARESMYWFLTALRKIKGQLQFYLIEEEKKHNKSFEDVV